MQGKCALEVHSMQLEQKAKVTTHKRCSLDSIGDKVHLCADNVHECSRVYQYLDTLRLYYLIKLAPLVCTHSTRNEARSKSQF